MAFGLLSSSSGFGQRKGCSFFLVLLSPFFIVGSAVLLFSNETRTVRETNSLKEGAAIVVEADSKQADASLEGKLVHLTGETLTSAPVRDPELGVEVQGVKLERVTEVYQWEESTHGKASSSTYEYATKWNGTLIDSLRFHDRGTHNNPVQLPYPSKTFQAAAVSVGVFQLDTVLVEKMRGAEPVPLTPESMRLPAGALLAPGGVIYVGKDPNSPAVGDIRINEKVTPNGPVSIVAEQKGARLVAHRSKNGALLALLGPGTQGTAQMFEEAETANIALGWMLRLVGFGMLFLGIFFIFSPLSSMASFVPILGAAVEGGVAIVSFLIALVAWCLLVGMAWLTARPLLAIPLFIVAFLGVAALAWLLTKRHAARQTRLAGEPPPIPR